MEKKRVDWLDVAKGLGIILVVLGHAMPSALRERSIVIEYLYNYIYFFHMPFWFLISGCAYRLADKKYRQMGFKSFFVSKAKTILVPYVSYAVLIYLIFVTLSFIPGVGGMLASAGMGRINVFKGIIGLLLGDNIYSIHLWYIYVLFAYYMITFLLKKLDDKVYLVVSWILGISTIILAQFVYTVSFMALSNMILCYFWFIAGVNVDFDKVKKGYVNVIGVAVWTVIYAVLYKFFENPNASVGENLIFVVYTMIMVVLLVGIAKTITSKAKDVLVKIGQNSFVIYLFHQPFFATCFISAACMILPWNIVVTIAILVISVIMCFVAPLIIVKILKKMGKIKYLFGIYKD